MLHQPQTGDLRGKEVIAHGGQASDGRVVAELQGNVGGEERVAPVWGGERGAGGVELGNMSTARVRIPTVVAGQMECGEM